MTETPPPSPARRGCAILLIATVAVGLAAGGFFWWQERQALQRQAAEAEAAFAPAREAMQAAEVAEPAYDIDQTIRALHEIDQAAYSAESLPDWLRQVGTRDYRDVAPEVLAARRELLDILQRLYGAQVELEDQEALWDFSASLLLLSTVSVVQVEGDLNPLTPSGAVSVDRAQAQELLDDLVARQEERGRLQAQLRGVEAELLDATLRYSEVFYKYVEEWDRLSQTRDRAYLAASRGDWARAAEAADAAMQQAPKEREAHLLRALAAIEGGEIETPEGAQATRALLTDFIDQHPERSAPALLLLGVLESRVGDPAEGRLRLDEAAKEYPRQSAALDDMLDPYRARAWLRKTPEGGRILDLYQSTMVGAGWFSPDLQMARLAFDAGDAAAGREQVLKHFSRRRNDKQWAALVSDLVYCYELLGDDYRAIFPEDLWLDLELSESTFGSSYGVKVRNRSDRALKNASLVLALRFTDMHAGDLQPFVVGKTQPQVAPHAVTDFGDVEVRYPLWGEEKTTRDVIDPRAVLVSDEAVIWVDTEQFKITEVKEAARAAAAAPRPQDTTQRMLSQALQGIRSEADLTVTKSFLKDDVTVRLPKQLALLRPFFKLRYGDQELPARENLILGDDIALTFEGVGDFEDLNAPVELELIAETPYGAVSMRWMVGPDGTARLLDAGLGR
ncbi:MAG: hypothetical protein H6739_12105 [Alphaproteobacteria bacterium]|nr:hypothetical protein [Alphaproteobacteria bacterium]